MAFWGKTNYLLLALLNILKCSLLHVAGENFLSYDATNQLLNDVMFDSTMLPKDLQQRTQALPYSKMMKWWSQLLNYFNWLSLFNSLNWSREINAYFRNKRKRHLQQRNFMVIGTCKNRSSAWNLFSNISSDLITLVNIKSFNSMLWLSIATKELWGLLWREQRGLNKPQLLSVSVDIKGTLHPQGDMEYTGEPKSIKMY